MNEWIDLLVYSVQALTIWIAMPRWCARFTRPMLTDRNPDWAAANALIIERIEQGGWWLKAMHTWGLLTILLLVVFRLGMQPAFLTPVVLRTPLWEVLMTTNNLMMLGGFLLWGYGMVSYFRWQKHSVPLAERRQATLVPRTTDDYVPRGFQYFVYGLMLLNVLARPIANLFWPDRVDNVWGSFAMALVMSVVLFLVGVGSVIRPPNHMDRVLGPVYRRMEVRVAFALMLVIVALGLSTLALDIATLDSKRYGTVLVSLFVTFTVVSCMRLPTQADEARPDAPGATGRRMHSASALLIPLVLPVALLALQPGTMAA